MTVRVLNFKIANVLVVTAEERPAAISRANCLRAARDDEQYRGLVVFVPLQEGLVMNIAVRKHRLG